MPWDGNQNYYYPPGTPGVNGQTIESDKYNTFLDDLVVNDLNAIRPVHRGGTGGATPTDAANALGFVKRIGDTMSGGLKIEVAGGVGPTGGAELQLRGSGMGGTSSIGFTFDNTFAWWLAAAYQDAEGVHRDFEIWGGDVGPGPAIRIKKSDAALDIHSGNNLLIRGKVAVAHSGNYTVMWNRQWDGVGPEPDEGAVWVGGGPDPTNYYANDNHFFSDKHNFPQAEMDNVRMWIRLPTQSTSPITGALRVDGGVGIGKNLYVGGEYVFIRSTDVGAKHSYLVLDRKAAAGGYSGIGFQNAGADEWSIDIGPAATANDFVLARKIPAYKPVFTIAHADGATTLNSYLFRLEDLGPYFELNSLGGGGSGVLSNVNNKSRWWMQFSRAIEESGSNVGSDFKLSAFDDAGNELRGGDDFVIVRSTGVVGISHTINLKGTKFVERDVNLYTRIYGYDDTNGAITLGYSADPTSYFRNTEHQFMPRTSGGPYTTIKATEIGQNTTTFTQFVQRVNGVNTGVFYSDATQVIIGGQTNIPVIFRQNNAEIMRFAASGGGIGIAGPLSVGAITTSGELNSAGNIIISKTTPALVLRKNVVADNCIIAGQFGLFNRWTINLADQSAESSPTSVGSDFSITRFSDGAAATYALYIRRSDGFVLIPGMTQFNTGIELSNGTANSPEVNFVSAGNPTIWMDNNAGFFKIAKTGASLLLFNVSTLDATFAADIYFKTLRANVTNNWVLIGDGSVVYDGSSYVGNLILCNTGGINMIMQSVHTAGVFAGMRLISQAATFDFRTDSQAYKTGGGSWGDISDARIKNVLGDYTSGLDAVAALQPVRYTFKGNDTSVPPSDAPPWPVDENYPKNVPVVPYKNSSHYGAAVSGKEFIGLIAQAAEVSMPEMVKQNKGYIDGVEVTDLRDLDTTPLIFALVNAVKELKARVEQLEAP